MSDEWNQIYAQIDAIIKAIPEHYLLDPPDGGDVSVAEGVGRMADTIAALTARVEELEDMVHQSDAMALGYATENAALTARVEELEGALNWIANVPGSNLAECVNRARAAITKGESND